MHLLVMVPGRCALWNRWDCAEGVVISQAFGGATRQIWGGGGGGVRQGQLVLDSGSAAALTRNA
jgi:hypothetical protein